MDTKAKTITLTEEEFDLIVALMYELQQDQGLSETAYELMDSINEMIDKH